MEQINILKKLNNELNRDITDECQVVYILSLIRKMLEMKKQKEKYELLNFYCNWSLHSNLDQKTKIISEMFDDHINNLEDANVIANRMKFNQVDFFKLHDLRDDLKKFTTEYDLSLGLLEKNNQWIEFVKLLLDVIEDCPIVCIKSSKKIRNMELKKNKDGNYSYKFSLVDRKRKPIVKLKFK
jgi:hypothetical protein